MDPNKSSRLPATRYQYHAVVACLKQTTCVTGTLCLMRPVLRLDSQPAFRRQADRFCLATFLASLPALFGRLKQSPLNRAPGLDSESGSRIVQPLLITDIQRYNRLAEMDNREPWMVSRAKSREANSWHEQQHEPLLLPATAPALWPRVFLLNFSQYQFK